MHYVAKLMINFKHPGRPQYLLKWVPTLTQQSSVHLIFYGHVFTYSRPAGGAQVDVEHLMHFIAVLFSISTETKSYLT